ncbi:MAG TPA: hypothetical protein VHR38_07540 [Solirubrobacterales bacterium]|nr:hypothetical protein [Solirubrobacterales bacterium]
MFSALLAGALIVGASLLLGAAIVAIAGLPRHSAAGPATGISALLVICGLAVKLPGHAVTAAIAVGVALIACFVVFGRTRSRGGTVRIGAIVVVVGTALVAAIPFAASGRVGILGQGLVNDDMASHLLFTEWVSTHAGPTPDLIKGGYPLGPHAIVAATAKVSGASLIEGFAGLTGAIAVLLGLTAYGALRGVRGWLRVPAAVLAASPYLAAAYLAQGAFKEPLLALTLFGFALALPYLLPEWSLRTSWGIPSGGERGTFAGGGAGARAVIPMGVILAGAIFNYSFPGLAWLLGAAVIWMVVIALRERDRAASWFAGLRLGERLRRARSALLLGIGIPVVCALPELFRLASFSSFKAFNPSGTGPTVGFGNLRQPLNPLEAFGIWPSGEFRITPANSTTPEIAFYLGGLLALAAFAWGLGRALSRRESALPSALLAATLIYLGALAVGTPYTQAKCLAIAAPLIMVIALRGLLSADAIEGEEGAVPEGGGASWWPPRPLRALAPIAVPLLTVAFAAAAAFSTLLPLRQAAVGPDYHLQEMLQMRPIVDGQNVLFLGRDNFVSWELIGSEVYAPITNHYDVEETHALYRATDLNAKFDWDNVPVFVMNKFKWVVTTSAAMQSQAPPGFSPRLRTHDFILWQRDHPVGQRRTLYEPINPGAPLDCGDPGAAKLRNLRGTATAFTVQPVVGRVWHPSPELTQTKAAQQRLYLTPGRWDISIQYASTQALQVKASGGPLAAPFDNTLRTNLLFRGPSPFYPVGTLEVKRPGEVVFDVSVDDPPLIGRLLHTESKAYLTGIAATRADPPRQAVPLRQACGRYVDWYEVAPGTPASALQGVPAPRVQPIEAD